MGNNPMIFVEILAAISVAFTVLYIILKRKESIKIQDENVRLSRYGVTVKYGEEEQLMWLSFYTNRIVFEKENGKKFTVLDEDIKEITVNAADDGYYYSISAKQSVVKAGVIDIFSKDSITDDFKKIAAGKINV